MPAYDEIPLPRGTLLTFRGTPVHSGRRLLLTDGTAEVPFVDDGSGHVVARWPLAESVKLKVVARFGEVVIPEPEITPVISIPDAAPIVTLEGAPKQIRLASEEDASEVPIHYEATDDHGLREVHLVPSADLVAYVLQWAPDPDALLGVAASDDHLDCPCRAVAGRSRARWVEAELPRRCGFPCLTSVEDPTVELESGDAGDEHNKASFLRDEG